MASRYCPRVALASRNSLRYERCCRAILLRKITLSHPLDLIARDFGVTLSRGKKFPVITEKQLIGSDRVGLAVDRLHLPVKLRDANVFRLLQLLVCDAAPL